MPHPITHDPMVATDYGTQVDHMDMVQEKEGWRNLLEYGTVAGVVCYDEVSVGGEKIQGESEPNYDPTYERQSLILAREYGRTTNGMPLEFRASIPWSGPVLYVIAFDEDGKELARSKLPGQSPWPPEFASRTLDFKRKRKEN